MRSKTLLAGVALSLVATAMATSPALAISGGVESARAYSFMGSLQVSRSTSPPPRPDNHGCGVELLAPQWVLTASHCNKIPTNATAGVPRGWTVRIGSLDTTAGGEVAEVDRFYTLPGRNEQPFGKDLMLLHLRTPVQAQPVRIAATTPADNADARILGWGNTCSNPNDSSPECYPTRLHEADTAVTPISECPYAVPGEVCVGSPDGVQRTGNTDSGGPVLVREDDQWVLAGVLSGPGDDDLSRSLYTDVTKHTGWINGIINGTDVPPDDVRPSVEGAVRWEGCGGSVVRTPDSRPEDPALMLTNGHCVQGDRPAPGQALVDQPADGMVNIADPQGFVQASARAVRLVYATMTGTDIALYRLDKTYAQLEAEGGRVFQLSTVPMAPGDSLTMALQSPNRLPCTAEAKVPHLRESDYQMDDSIRYVTTADCTPGHGASGSALLAPDGNTVLGVHNTHSDDGEQCTENNPCEVAADGTVTAVKGRGYGQQVHMIPGCLTTGSQLDLSRAGCTLTGAGPRP